MIAECRTFDANCDPSICYHKRQVAPPSYAGCKSRRFLKDSLIEMMRYSKF